MPEWQPGGDVIVEGKAKSAPVKKTVASPYRVKIGNKERPLKSGAVLKLKKKQSFEILLDQQGSTGYGWSLKEESLPHVTFKGETTESKPAPTPGMTGYVDSAKVFSFVAKNEKGEGTIEFEYSRPWEKTAAPAKTVTVSYKIK